MSIDKNRYSALGLDSEIETCHDGCPPTSELFTPRAEGTDSVSSFTLPQISCTAYDEADREGGRGREGGTPSRSKSPPANGWRVLRFDWDGVKVSRQAFGREHRRATGSIPSDCNCSQ